MTSYTRCRSLILQPSDYEAPSAVDPFTTGYVQTSRTMEFRFNTAAAAFLSRTPTAQFRITLTPNTFTNRNGERGAGR
jgi:hypothetical protein